MKFMIPLVLALVFSSAAEGYFHHAIGVQDPSIIPDNQMTASSYYSSLYYPYFGRLHNIRGGGWAGRTPSNPSDWLQVDFGRIALVCAVATQGNPYLNEWVIDFSLSFSSDGASWMHSNDSQGNKMVFTRLGNNSYVDQQTLPAPMSARYIRFHPISQHSWNTLRVEVYEAFSPVTTSAPGYFRHAIGVQDPSIIPDNQMTASSYYSSSYYPYFGRLHDIRGGGWAGRTPSNPSDWLQVDFGRIALVCAVATQGDTYGSEWVIDFSLSFSSDGASWMHSNDSQGNKMVFTRLGNNSYVDQQTLPAPMSARYIRFHPISQHSWNTLRVEVYEVTTSSPSPASGYFRHAIGVQDPSIIPDNQMTASSYYSSSYYPYFGRLHDIRGGGWAGRTPSNPSDWLQVDFGRIALVCAVATQGDTYGSEWVIDFSLSFSSDGASWMHSNDSQGNKMVFTRLGNNSYVDQQTLPAPMSARYIRFHPISQHSWNTLRVEVYEAFSPVTTSAPGYFRHAIGVQDPSIIPDNQMTASSYYSSSYYPYFGRLHDIRGGGWAGRTPSNPSDWLQVDFGRIALVCAVATQGDTYGSEWVIDFSLSFSSDGASWMHSNDSQGNKMVFTRLGNNSYVDQQTLPAPMSARYIRFHPISQHSWNTLRVEVYEAFSPVTTSAPGYFRHAIGVQDPSIIPDNQMTASSYYSSAYYPYFGRLHDIRGGGWAGRTPSNLSDWLQVDFGRIALVCAVATQGDTYGSEWVIDFSLSFSSDGASWMHSNDSQGNKMASLYLLIFFC
ncbi:uncharacterized protein LOC114952391 isoform X3 [Acropora millepora]|uniref:uncharacterized protein LOC114952391 isoform X3 n=1 Tax=Acropora millepora TaxID=45264 RepID=UPI001CF585F0|nr:uncharacterized protein LOC114952391 isoform X3 [Acropora millepora]